MKESLTQDDLADYYLQLMIANHMISASQPGTEIYEAYLQTAHDLSILLLKELHGNPEQFRPGTSGGVTETQG